MSLLLTHLASRAHRQAIFPRVFLQVYLVESQVALHLTHQVLYRVKCHQVFLVRLHLVSHQPFLHHTPRSCLAVNPLLFPVVNRHFYRAHNLVVFQQVYLHNPHHLNQAKLQHLNLLLFLREFQLLDLPPLLRNRPLKIPVDVPQEFLLLTLQEFPLVFLPYLLQALPQHILPHFLVVNLQHLRPAHLLSILLVSHLHCHRRYRRVSQQLNQPEILLEIRQLHRVHLPHHCHLMFLRVVLQLIPHVAPPILLPETHQACQLEFPVLGPLEHQLLRHHHIRLLTLAVVL